MKRKVSNGIPLLFYLSIVIVFLSSSSAMANSFFWQGKDIDDSGPVGLLDYSKQKEVHDALLDALPVILYPEGLYADDDGSGPSVPYNPDLDSLPNPNGGVGLNGNLNRMYQNELIGDPGLRIPCEKGKKGKKGQCWDGYTFLANGELIDMDGTLIRDFGEGGTSFGGAPKILKGGYYISGEGRPRSLVQRDWCGVEEKRFAGLSNHHDHQREGSPVGYYAPGRNAFTDRGKTLSLGSAVVGPEQILGGPTGATELVTFVEDTTHLVNVQRFDPARPHRPITDDVIREIPWDWDGTNALFEWHARDHFDQFGFDEAAKYAMDLGLNSGGGSNSWSNVTTSRDGTLRAHTEDWSHGNSVAWLGKNIWYKKYKDQRFHPDNIIADFRSLNTTIIIARYDHPQGDWSAGDIVWQLGPNYGTDGPDGQVGQIIGQHMAYMIPNTLPGGGNILLFDNGGGAGYGALIEGLTDDNGTPEDYDDDVRLGFWPNKYRTFSRVLEINPMTKQIVWQYVQAEPTQGDGLGNNHTFFSNIMAGAQRLPNRNTLITEADTGRVFEVTPENKVVWEYAAADVGFGLYRAYRIPYSWIPKKALKDKNNNDVYDMCE